MGNCVRRRRTVGVRGGGTKPCKRGGINDVKRERRGSCVLEGGEEVCQTVSDEVGDEKAGKA